MLWNDPDRWVDADMQRDAWLRLACWAVIITVLIICLGLLFVAIVSR
jgi:hypothetical protein